MDVSLLPLRRQEIVYFLMDHPYCSFDMLRRNFMLVKPPTLHYELQQLIKLGIIFKIGLTRGATYKAREV